MYDPNPMVISTHLKELERQATNKRIKNPFRPHVPMKPSVVITSVLGAILMLAATQWPGA